ncbi:MAG: universal stress protein [Methylococcaceae bacterium]|nr:universal stress protein [Methylococcaceae bacterium]
MGQYRNILVGIDFSEFNNQTIERARMVAEQFGAQLNLLHVVEPLPLSESTYGGIGSFNLDIAEQMAEAARQRLATLGESLSVTQNKQWVEIGSPKVELVRIAAENQIDLIVVGTHGRHGIGLLLGSTAASVVHHAGCDVLTVRLREV